MRCLLCSIDNRPSRAKGSFAYALLDIDIVSEAALLAYANNQAGEQGLPIILDTAQHGPTETKKTVALIHALRANHFSAAIIVASHIPLPYGSNIYLNAGADDVVSLTSLNAKIVKDEIPARLNAILRRIHHIATPQITVGGLSFPLDGRMPQLGGSEIELSAREYDILRQLVINKGKIVSKSTLYDNLYALVPLPPLDKIIDVYICRLRAKFKSYQGSDAPLIDTIKGRGYRLNDHPLP